MSTVFVTQRAEVYDKHTGKSSLKFKNLHKAEKFGALRFVFENKHHAYSPKNAVSHARDVMRHLHESDYILPMGNVTLIGLCFAEAALELESVRVLHWSTRDQDYVPLVFEL